MNDFVTKDLALTVALQTHGYEPKQMVLRGKEAFWVFSGNGGLKKVTDAYEAQLLTVEPRMFTKKLRVTRDELFNFLGKNGVRPAGRGWSRPDKDQGKRTSK